MPTVVSRTVGTGIAGSAAAGTVTVTPSGTVNVVGSGTAFTTALKDGSGNPLTISVGGILYSIASITDNTHLTLTANYTPTFTGSAYTPGLRNFANVQDWGLYFATGPSWAVSDEIPEAIVYNDSEFTASGPVIDASAWSVVNDATHPWTITTAPGQSFRDVNTNPLYYNAANGVSVRNIGASGYTINVGASAWQLNNLQVEGQSGASGVLTSQSQAAVQTVNNCIFVGPEVQTQVPITYTNCLFVNTLGPFTRGFNIIQPITCYYCLFITNPSLAYYFNFDANVTATFGNCGFFGGGTTAFSSGTGTVVFSAPCMTDNPAPTTNLISGKVFANQFVSTTNNFRVKAGADLIGAGTPISVLTDVYGNTRSSTAPTIGLMEVAGSAPPVTDHGRMLRGMGGSVSLIGWRATLPAAAAWKFLRPGVMTRRSLLLGRR